MIKVRRKRSWIEKLKNWICYLIPNKIPIVLKENWDMLSGLGALNSDESFSFIWALTRVLGAVWIHVAFKFPVFSPFSFFLGTCFPNKRLLFMHYSWTVVATFDQVFREQCTLTKSSVNSARIHTFHFSTTFSLKMSSTILFTHLKIILL